MMDYAIKYIKSNELKEETLAPLNQVWIHKRILIPCELVGFSGNKITKVMREKEKRSCIEWKIKVDIAPKPSTKWYRIWGEYLKWLKEK